MTVPAALVAFVYGAALGSFINVVSLRFIDRLALTVPWSRSRCPHCQRVLRWWELIPIFSFLALRGRCRRCGGKISYQYLVAELLMGGLTALVVNVSLPLLPTLLLIALVGVLLALAIIDYHTFLLPDSFIGILTVIVLGYLYVRGALLLAPVVGGIAVGAGFLLLLWLATRGQGIGLGDVKLMVPLGALFGWREGALVLFVAFFLGGMMGLLLLWRARATLKTAVPFGPFIIAAAWLVLLWPPLKNYFFSLLVL